MRLPLPGKAVKLSSASLTSLSLGFDLAPVHGETEFS